MLCLRMHGEGEYTFSTNTKYVGEMKDGMFHGKGMLLFPNGIKYESIWEDGISKQVSANPCMVFTLFQRALSKMY